MLGDNSLMVLFKQQKGEKIGGGRTEPKPLCHVAKKLVTYKIKGQLLKTITVT